ncbi:MAG: hypothetical protein ABI591_15910 [Kofleriaceae bacterium]
MKTLLWLAAAAGALVAAAEIVKRMQRKQLRRAPLAIAGGVPYEIFEAEIIEIVPFDPSGPAIIDQTTIELLEELAHEGLFAKSRM